MSIASSPVIARHVGNMSWQSHTLLPTLFVFFTLSLLPTSLLLYFTKNHNNGDGFMFYRFLGSQTVNLPLSDEEKFLLMVNPLLSSFFVIANLPKAGVAISSSVAHIFAFLSFIVAHILYILTKNQEPLTINLFHLYPHLHFCHCELPLSLRHCETCWKHAVAISSSIAHIFAFLQNTKY